MIIRMTERDNELMNTVYNLSQYMKNNFKYAEFTTLKSPYWVYKNKKGSCHDQVMYELSVFRKCGLNPKADFFIQVDDNGQGYQTHSFVYFESNDKYIWFENAWEDQAGVRVYDSSEHMKTSIEKKLNSPKGIHILWGTFDDSKLKIGDDLQTIVNKCLD